MNLGSARRVDPRAPRQRSEPLGLHGTLRGECLTTTEYETVDNHTTDSDGVQDTGVRGNASLTIDLVIGVPHWGGPVHGPIARVIPTVREFRHSCSAAPESWWPCNKRLDLHVGSRVYGVLVTNAYRIKDVADRSGFSATALRYYEDIGLLPTSRRTAAGYRLYDDRSLDRLAFIARAKQLGCSLDEINDLTFAWDGGQCGPLQDRLQALVAAKLLAARRQIDELTVLVSELERASMAFEMHRPEGPCDERCGCVAAADDPSTDTPSRAVSMRLKPTAAGRSAFGAPL